MSARVGAEQALDELEHHHLIETSSVFLCHVFNHESFVSN